jgi:hypothetical protein
MKTATVRKETVLNGVNVEELFKTIDEVKKKSTAVPSVRHRIASRSGFGGIKE